MSQLVSHDENLCELQAFQSGGMAKSVLTASCKAFSITRIGQGMVE